MQSSHCRVLKIDDASGGGRGGGGSPSPDRGNSVEVQSHPAQGPSCVFRDLLCLRTHFLAHTKRRVPKVGPLAQQLPLHALYGPCTRVLRHVTARM